MEPIVKNECLECREKKRKEKKERRKEEEEKGEEKGGKEKENNKLTKRMNRGNNWKKNNTIKQYKIEQ
jgi:hypothetical protein